jgi:hypothetical protein
MANKQPTVVTCEGVSFEVGRLDLNASCKGLELVTRTVGPAFAQADVQARMVTALSNASKIPELLALFAPVTRVCRDPAGAYISAPTDGRPPPWVALAPFLEDVFQGNLTLAVSFLTECVGIEYGAFLASMLSAGNQAAKP